MSRVESPEEVMARLLSTPGVSERRKASLRLVHEVCQTRFGLGKSDFRISTVAQAVGEVGPLSSATVRSDENNEYRQIALAWRLRAESRGPVIDMEIPVGHPDAVLQKLLQAPGRRNNKRDSLSAIHAVCRTMFERGDLDFRGSAVQKAADQLKAEQCGKIYRTGESGELLHAWEAYAANTAASTQAAKAGTTPEDVLKQLLMGPGRKTASDQRLQAVHDVCEARYRSGELYLNYHDVAADAVAAGAFVSLASAKAALASKANYKAILIAWQEFIDRTWLNTDEHLPRDHPDAVYRRLIRKVKIAHKRSTLQKFHVICKTYSEGGNLDFRPPVIGRLCAEQGLLGKASLSSPALKDYRILLDSWAKFVRPWLAQNVPTQMPERIQKGNDRSLEWVRRDHPELEHWRQLAVEWIAGKEKGMHQCLTVFARFFKSYLTRPDVPKTLGAFFRRGIVLPKYSCVFQSSDDKKEQAHINVLVDFFDWVLVNHLSEKTDDDEVVLSPAYKNPFQRVTGTRGRVLFESVRSPLPYGYIHELRSMLACGPTFRDWAFAQVAQGAPIGESGAPGRDWYQVDPSEIDRDDPDCVWRIRVYKGANGGPDRSVYQMWSPVRWVAVLVKLLVPLRTAQLRLLDSGESDKWKYVGGAWILNDHPLAAANAGDLWQQGVLRRCQDPLRSNAASTLLYINTNKTADQDKSGPHKGYVTPWFNAPDPTESVFYWLEKLRNWQSKYNPILQRTSWRALDGRHISVKSMSQLDSYLDTCFLFRVAESPQKEERGFPVSDGVVSHAWALLLHEFQHRLASRGETHPGGLPIELVPTDPKGQVLAPHFPLHSLRVSLITALALDGGVPFPILQKLVGHSRLLMTIYYTKVGHTRTAEILAKAAERLDADKDRTVHKFLLDTEYDKLVESAVCNSSASLAAVIPIHPAERNAAGWMPMHHGLCLVGGNTSEVEGERAIGGCYNGGANVGTKNKPAFGPVPGGSRNCVRCRWFVTEPHFIPALSAHFNVIAYHFDEARNESIAAEASLQEIRRRKAALEASSDGQPFLELRELVQRERLWESSLKRFSDLAEDLFACWRLIERCMAVLNDGDSGGAQLIAQGDAVEAKAIFEETESELLQLCGVCSAISIYPDLDAGKAVLRRSQLLDSALYNEGLPPMFLRLSEADQLKIGNAFVQRLARHADPADQQVGQRKIIEMIDLGEKIGDALGIDLRDFFFERDRERWPQTPLQVQQKLIEA